LVKIGGKSNEKELEFTIVLPFLFNNFIKDANYFKINTYKCDFNLGTESSIYTLSDIS
jgi:hypothetical protein